MPSTPTRAICRPRCCCRSRAISAARCSRRMQNTAVFRRHPRGRQRGRVRPPAGLGHGAVRDRDSGQLRAAVRRGDRPALLVAADATDPVAAGSAMAALGNLVQTRAPARPGDPGQRHAGIRDPHPRPLQSRGQHLAQHRAGARRHHPHHDHADLHRALGDARDRARHHGKPAGDADHAGRDHAGQDHPLHHRRVRAGGAHHRHRVSGCSACRCSGAWRCWRC